jgi:hypothetical protein
MAEVRQIPSAVGAFEAQIFDFNKTYNTIQQQEAARRKANADLKKEMDKSLLDLSTQKAKGRSQDLGYLNGLEKDLIKYYSDNAGSIKPGTEQYTKYNELRSNFLYEAQRSINAKEQQKEFATFATVNADKDVISDQSRSLISLQQKPINDPVWNTFKYKRKDGSDVGIVDIGTMDLDKYAKYHEEDTRQAVEALKDQTVESVSFATNYLGTKVPRGTILTEKVVFTDPAKIIGTFDSQYRDKKDSERVWSEQWNSLPKDEKDRIVKLYNELPNVYKAAGLNIDLQVDKADGQPGISSGYEYGQVKFLLQNLPKEVGAAIDLKLANFYQDEEYKRRMLAFRKETKIKENLDTGLAKNLLDTGFSLSNYANSFNNMIGLSGAWTGTKYRPVTIKSVDNKNKTMTAQMAFALTDGPKDARINVDSYNKAKQITGLDVYKPGAKEWITKDPKGNWVRVKRETYNINPNTVGYEGNIGQMHNEMEEAIRLSGDVETLNYFKSLRTTGATLTPVSGQVENVFMNL